MQILHKIDSFLFTLFPELVEKNNDVIINSLESYYTIGPYKPKVSIKDSIAYIEIDMPTIQSEKKDYDKVVELCDEGYYERAKPILSKLIDKNPSVSEYHRIMGQILSDEGDQDEAINCLIDALRWDSKNSYALLMVGNIYSKHHNDIETALKYYEHALLANPNDYITMVNIGVNLFQSGNIKNALKYINNALEIKKDFPNAHMALTLIAKSENNWKLAFQKAQETLKLCKTKDVIYQNAFNVLIAAARKLVESGNVEAIVQQYKGKLEALCDKNITITKDPSIPVIAKIQIAEFYDRSEHRLLYKNESPHLSHLLMHEMMHLDFIIQARKAGTNKKMTCHKSQREAFIKSNQSLINRMDKMGIDPDTAQNALIGMMDGLNSLIYNTPIDLFIEQYLYDKYEELRPYQLLSLLEIVKFGIEAVTNRTVIDITPLPIIKPTITLNLVMALHLKALFGVDLIEEHKAPNSSHLEMAQTLYEEFLEYRDDREPGEEYELIKHWGEDLKINQNFTLQEEEPKENNIDELLSGIENNLLVDDDYTLEEKREMKKFLKNHSSDNVNPAIAMFMVNALHYFKNQSKEQIKKIAFEIAQLGMHGINPNSSNYKVPGIPGKVFSGNQLLAYFYTSWAIAIPEALPELQLPFDKEFELAKHMVKQ